MRRGHGFHQVLGSFGFRRENCDQVISIDIDERGRALDCLLSHIDEPSWLLSVPDAPQGEEARVLMQKILKFKNAAQPYASAAAPLVHPAAIQHDHQLIKPLTNRAFAGFVTFRPCFGLFKAKGACAPTQEGVMPTIALVDDDRNILTSISIAEMGGRRDLLRLMWLSMVRSST
jgi:hypothetical protein